MLDPRAIGSPQRGRRPRPLLRTTLGGVLRRTRSAQRRTLADVARAAKVSMPYLSEVERGRKEASSEVLAAICDALRIDLADLLALAGRDLAGRRTPAVRHMIRPDAAQPDPGRPDAARSLIAPPAAARPDAVPLQAVTPGGAPPAAALPGAVPLETVTPGGAPPAPALPGAAPLETVTPGGAPPTAALPGAVPPDAEGIAASDPVSPGAVAPDAAAEAVLPGVVRLEAVRPRRDLPPAARPGDARCLLAA